MRWFKDIFFPNRIRSSLSGLGFLVGLVSGIFGILEFLKPKIYDYRADVVYLDGENLAESYEHSAETAAYFMNRTDFDGGEREPFLFYLKISDYRGSIPSEDIEGVDYGGYLGVTNGILTALFSPGCSQWHDGVCDELFVIFDIPGHSEVYGGGVDLDDATRQHLVLTGRHADDGEFYDQNGKLGPNKLIFSFQHNGQSTFGYNATETDIEFYASISPVPTGGGYGEMRYSMKSEDFDPEKLRATAIAAENAANRLLSNLRGF